MNLVKEVKNILKKYNLKPKKYFGQNFLINEEVLKAIIEAANLKSDDIILEIGPGFGVLTRKLAKRAEKVIAVEKDKKLVKILKDELSDLKNVEIIEGDILKIEISNLKNQKYKIVANLPYYITSPVIRKFLESKNPPVLAVLMVQKEVAERICQKPPKMSLLSVAVQFYSLPEIVKIVKKDCFRPEPKVDSAIMKLKTYNKQLTTKIDRKLFFKIVKAGFSQPRKQLKNNLKKIFDKKTEKILKASKIEGIYRAETLKVKDWLKICENFQNEIK